MTLSLFERWPDLEEIFAEALDLPPEQRSAFLRERCGQEELVREIEALIEAESLSRTLFGDGAPTPRPEASPPPRQDFPGEGAIVGAYRLVRTLGRGGSSTVYLAERAEDDFRQRVAVKILDPSLMGRVARERFNQERQILAHLQHPNIARLLDGGVTSDGWPYIVMDYVDGIPIDRYCNGVGLSVKKRLELVRTVCDAVHHAHTSLVVHRDLKPGNVLVTPQGDVKLLDFGIAKILEGDDSFGPPLETRTGTWPMTPAYAAPEQIAGEPVTTTTDVYQIGALLFHLLTGRRPFGSAATLAGLRERLERDAPDLPSRVAGRGPGVGTAPPDDDVQTPEDTARERATSVSGLRAQLRGELDTLIVTAMKRDPARRYSSAEALATDIQRYLDGRPLLAHPDSVAYRMSKFLRRHPFSAPLSAATLMALVVLSLGLARQMERAEQERAKAEQVTRFLVSLFERPDPASAATDTLTAKAVLAEGAERVRESLTDHPLVQAAVMNAVGSAYMGLGRLDDAESLLVSALAIRQQELPEGDPVTATTLHNLGELLIERRDPAGAERYFRDALRSRRRAHGWRAPEVAQDLGGLGLALHAQGRYDEAEALYREALAIYRSSGRALDQAATETLVNLGWLQSNRGNATAAEALFREALVIRRSLHGSDHASVASALTALAEVERKEGRSDSALVHATSAVAVQRRVFGPRNANVAGSLITLGGTYLSAGRLDEAEAAYREALTITIETVGADTPDAARILNDLGNLLRDRGNLVAAEDAGRRAVLTYQSVLGPDHLFTGIAQHNVGTTLAALDRVREAEASLTSAIAVFESNGLGSDVRTARSLVALGALRTRSGAPATGEPALRRALEIFESGSSPDLVQVGTVRAYLGRCLALQDRLPEAEELLLQAHRDLESSDGPVEPSRGQVAGWLAELYEAQGRDGEAARFRLMARR